MAFFPIKLCMCVRFFSRSGVSILFRVFFFFLQFFFWFEKYGVKIIYSIFYVRGDFYGYCMALVVLVSVCGIGCMCV